MKKILVCSLLPVLLYSCQSEKDRLSKIWFYTYSTGSTDPRDTLLTPASFLDLRNNGTYTMDFSGFDAGKWELAGSQLVLTNDKNEVTRLAVRYASGKELRLYVHDAVFKFEGYPNQSMTDAEDPFSGQNNRWRRHARARETDQQLTARLANHFAFWEAYFTWALEHHIDYIDVRSTPTLIKIYGNGFGLKPMEQLPGTWKAYFYDEEDCRRANDKVKALFDNNSIGMPHTENKFEMFISAFQQLRQKI